MKRRHLVLIGMMGSGKSTVGRAAAAKLGVPVVDTDERIVASAGTSISEIFATRGEAAFRAIERAAVHAAAEATTPTVIACGGGVVIDPDNRAVLRQNGVVIWLDASIDVLTRRVGDGSRRPILAGKDPATVLHELMEARAAAYAAAAHCRIDTSSLSTSATVDAVLREYETLHESGDDDHR